MNQLDLTEIQYSVTAHRYQLRSELADSYALQRRWVTRFGRIVFWVGVGMVKWGRMLQAAVSNEQWQDVPH
ncbi:MAG TPA: hypothetical protein P5121_36840 [Caldilineaceae bacterium]|nr:hypothetical protein [Caldilineaceae bacterium]